MDQKIQTGQTPEFLQQLLANPAAASQAHQQQLEALVQTYPQCSVFHLLLAKALQNNEVEIAAKALQTAAVHAAKREVLFRLMYEPESIIKPKTNQLYGFSSPETADQNTVFNGEKQKDDLAAFAQTYPVEIINTSFINPKPVEITDEEAVAQEEIPGEEITDAAFIDPKPAEIEDEDVVFVKDIPGEEITDTAFIDPKAAEIEDEDVFFVKDIPGEELTDASFIDLNSEEAIIAENDLRVEDVNLTFTNESAEEIVFPMEETIAQQQEEKAVIEAKNNFSQEIDEEVYDEITAIEDIRFESIKTASPQKTETIAEPEPQITIEETPTLTIQDKAEKDMLSSIASIDYFSFNNRFGQKQMLDAAILEAANPSAEIKNETNLAVIQAEIDEAAAQKEPETVSNYHDDKMPYTFMWWLDRTRKEYAGTYQPYVKVPQTQQTEQKLSVGPELHQQYIESIFHTKPPHDLTETTLPSAILPPIQRKENQLIERFIIEEPHIHPPSMDRLDTENKAKKSSEDGDILVTETLAKIYLDQMLYHKALDTYQKLILKFPEKSRYFTNQIELIEKKIN